MAEELQCWRCGASLAGLRLPIGRTEECSSCRSQLHVCRMCQSFDRSRLKQCREDDAEEVRDKEHANFCDWYKPRAGAFDAAGAAAEEAARNAANALFGPKKT
ncbi:MAG: hypothetical protein R3F24_08360 [Gammaproteobacteria bacterium]